MVGIQNTKGINNLHSYLGNLWVLGVSDLSCIFITKRLFLDGLITILPSVSIRSEG